MKKILYMLPLLLLALSCKEDKLDVYHGQDYVHFTPGAQDSSVVSYNFALDGITTRETEAEIPVEIRLWGYLPVADFKCKMSVDSERTTAVASDYTDPGYTVFRAGYHVDTLWVNVKRRAELLATDYKVVIVLDDAGDDHTVAPAKYNFVTVSVTDKIDSEPVWWGTTQDLGTYSDIKYRLLNLYLGKILYNLDGYTNITFKQEALAFKSWLKDKWDAGEYKYTEDGKPLYETIPD